mgnify:CR=1 FL=1
MYSFNKFLVKVCALLIHAAKIDENFTDKEQRDYKDDELGHVDMQQLVPVLVKSIQQLSAKIKVLEAQVDELGGV